MISAAPTMMSEETLSQYSMINENPSNKGFTSSEVEYAPTSKSKLPPMSTLPMVGEPIALATTPTPRINSNSKYQAIHPSSMKPRKNKKEVFFYGDREENSESATETLKRSKERERNTKPPVLKRPKNPESDEPSFERRPALLLRFFPDGTAVLISKFQLHLHVKPKQIRFEPEEDSTFDEPLEYDPSLLLNDGKSFEVTYKRLEAIPTTREHNLDEIAEEESDKYVSDSYDEEIRDHRDHELVTHSTSLMMSPESPYKNGRISPILDGMEKQNITSTITEEPKNVMDGSKKEEINDNTRQKVEATIGDSPFFIMTSGEMSALQHQYEPVHAEALRATPPPMTEEQTTISQTDIPLTTQTEAPSTTKTTIKEPSTEATTETTFITTEPTITTTKCLSFRNQLSLALSTEDNIDNALLKKNILPVEDCNTTETKESDTFEKLQSPETTEALPTTTTEIPTTQSTTLPTTQTPTTTPNPSSNNLVPYLASNPTSSQLKSNPVVVTSLPVLIDLRNSRNSPVTDAPAWREVTVGVVRDQQGQTLKPRYNNWTAHLRTMKRKPGNKFWNELTTPQPGHDRLPSQTIQQAPSHVHQAFWTDIQRQRPSVDHQSRNRQTIHSQNYQVNPPRNYHSPNVNEYQWRNSGYNSNNNRWNANIPETFHPSEDVRRMKSPMTNQRNFENQDMRQVPQWNHGNPRRW
ncbi:hypothetical protein JTE90_008033 [Oedothorax gibbosus]|uniref:Uncharacterized protein n=1 Tax=Oedothorax gibbosus TaxID=931172 RepID=A0AAV6UXN5_9ARAC|nr:hypothetical protein JTE90_008033 [Oedothorax gibbosus]